MKLQFASVGSLSLGLVLLFFCSAQGQKTGTVTYSPPAVLPVEAEAEFLYGKVYVEVKVDATGKVTDVRSIRGPNGTCSNYDSPGLTALRHYVGELATQITFEPVSEHGKHRSKIQTVSLTFAPGAEAPGSTDPAILDLDTKTEAELEHLGAVAPKEISLPGARFPDGSGGRPLAKVSVLLRIVVDEKGRLVSAEAVKSDAPLRGVAHEAVCRARLKPTLVNGKPVKIVRTIIYDVALQ